MAISVFQYIAATPSEGQMQPDHSDHASSMGQGPKGFEDTAACILRNVLGCHLLPPSGVKQVFAARFTPCRHFMNRVRQRCLRSMTPWRRWVYENWIILETGLDSRLEAIAISLEAIAISCGQ